MKGQRQREATGRARERRESSRDSGEDWRRQERKSGGKDDAIGPRRTVKGYEFWVRNTNILSQ